MFSVDNLLRQTRLKNNVSRNDVHLRERGEGEGGGGEGVEWDCLFFLGEYSGQGVRQLSFALLKSHVYWR